MEGKGLRWLVAAFFVVIAIEFWNWFQAPAPSSPYEPYGFPPPYIITAPCVVYGMLAIFGEVVNDEIAGAIGLGLAIGVVIAKTQNQLTGNTPAPIQAQVAASQQIMSGPNANAA